MRGRNRVRVEQPSVISVVGASVAAQVGDTDADNVVCVCGYAQPGLAGRQSVEAGRSANGWRTSGVESIPDADRGHGLGVRGRAGLVESLSHYGKNAIAAHGEGEPVRLTD